MGADLSLFNGEPGAGQLQSTVFGGAAVLELPSDLEDPFITYEEDLTRYKAFELANESASKRISRALERLRRDGTVSQSWAVENDSILPPAFKRPPINSYSITPSKTNYSMACEMATWAIAGLALAGLAAVIALGWKFYHYITGGSTSSSSGGGGGGDSGAAAKAKVETVEAAIKEREERTEVYSVIAKDLVEIIGKHSNKVKITEAAVGAEIYNNLKSTNTTPDGVMMSLQVMTDLVKAAYKNAPDSPEAEVLNGGAKNPAAYIFFLKPEQASILVALVKETKTELAKISKEATDMIAKMSDFNATAYHNSGKSELAGMIAQFRQWLPDAKIKSPIVGHLAEIKRLTSPPEGNPKWTATIPSLLNVVSARDDAFTTIFKDLQENLYIGEGNALTMLDTMLRTVDDFAKVMNERKAEAVKAGTRPPGKTGDEDTNRDTAAKEMSDISAFLKANLSNWQTLLKEAEQFCNAVKKLDHAIANILVRGLKLMDAIFKDNQVKLEAFDEMAEKIGSKLGRKGIFKGAK